MLLLAIYHPQFFLTKDKTCSFCPEPVGGVKDCEFTSISFNTISAVMAFLVGMGGREEAVALLLATLFSRSYVVNFSRSEVLLTLSSFIMQTPTHCLQLWNLDLSTGRVTNAAWFLWAGQGSSSKGDVLFWENRLKTDNWSNPGLVSLRFDLHQNRPGAFVYTQSLNGY